MRILTLDLSISRTGYAVLKSSRLIEYGAILPINKPGWKKEMYPQQTIHRIQTVIPQLLAVIEKQGDKIQHILIEEVNPNKKSGVKSIKSLAMLHGAFLNQLNDICLAKVQYISSAEWRHLLDIHKGEDWKKSTIEYVNQEFDLMLQYEENDEADAIAIGLAFFKKLDKLSIL